MTSYRALLLLLCFCFSITGCGGCGGEPSAEERMRRAAMARSQATKDKETQAEKKAAAAPAPPPAAEAAKPDASKPTVAGATPPAAPVGPVAPAFVITPTPKPSGSLSPADRRRRTIDNLHKIGQALQKHLQKTSTFPAATMLTEEGQPTLSWRVAILKELGYGELFAQFKLDEPWDSPSNRRLLVMIPPEYQSPERFDESTNYLAPIGNDVAFGPSARSLNSFEDGPENTLLLVEADESRVVPWTRPVDFIFNNAQPRNSVSALREDGFFGLLASGEVRLVPKNASDKVVQALFSMRGGEEQLASAVTRAATGEVDPTAIASAATAMAQNGAAGGNPALTTGAPPAELGSLLAGGTSAPDNSTKRALPEGLEVQKSRLLMKELFGADFKAARNREQKVAFLQRLLKEAAKIDDHSSDYYELMQICRKLAISVGDVVTTMKIVYQLDSKYQLADPYGLRMQSLEELVQTSKLAASLDAFVAASEQAAIEAFEADQFDAAAKAFELMQQGVRLRGNKSENAYATQMKEVIDEARKSFSTVPKALISLTTNPADPQANEVAGKYLCFVKGNWEAGLPMLAKGGDVKLQVLARLDLEAKQAPQFLYLGDEYQRNSAEYKQPYKRGLQLRAIRCYHLAVKNLASGLERLKAQKKIDEGIATYGKAAVDRACSTVKAIPNEVAAWGKLDE